MDSINNNAFFSPTVAQGFDSSISFWNDLSENLLSTWKDITESLSETVAATVTDLTPDVLFTSDELLDRAQAKGKQGISDLSPFKIREIVSLFHNQLELEDLRTLMQVSKFQSIMAKLTVIHLFNTDRLTPLHLGLKSKDHFEGYFPRLFWGKITKLDTIGLSGPWVESLKNFPAVYELKIVHSDCKFDIQLKNVRKLTVETKSYKSEGLKKFVKNFPEVNYITAFDRDSNRVDGRLTKGEFLDKPLVTDCLGRRYENIYGFESKDEYTLSPLKESEGSLTYPNGTVFKGSFFMDCPLNGTINYPDGTISPVKAYAVLGGIQFLEGGIELYDLDKLAQS